MMMIKSDSAENHPDIEIYLKAVPAAAVEAWLKQRFSQVELLKQKRQIHHFLATHDGHEIPILVIEKAVKNFTSVLFESDQTPWQQDILCAREAYSHFNKEIRCIASSWSEGEEPDEWIAINEEGEEPIIWRI
ncbi:MAG: hypothetical protein V7739_05935 [Motiliproteus sp.]